MAMASSVKVVLRSIAFAVFWVLAVFPAVPFLPIGRTAGSLLGAMLMVIFRVLTHDQAYAAIDLPILGLLFGTMVVSIYLERADMFKCLGKLLLWKIQGAKDLLYRICLISAISSALFTNDTSCVVLTEFVLKVAKQHNLPPHPFLLTLASSANIGRKKKVYAWTVDDMDSMQEMLYERVDAIVTSNPTMLQGLMQDIKTECLEHGFSLSE
ncbi:hypothetical protein ACE6H2_025822 [Prunus campanulata]